MSTSSTVKRAKTASLVAGHGEKPYIVPAATLAQFLATYRFTPKRYAAFVKKYFGNNPLLPKHPG